MHEQKSEVLLSFFFFCPTNRPTFTGGKAIGNETFYGDGLSDFIPIFILHKHLRKGLGLTAYLFLNLLRKFQFESIIEVIESFTIL